ncbi:hypothetical protein clem_08135 [Legionella clemsonensis]|uniref:Uncharacterized protein n=1 Tax=Legionella clemsonensis TaxID=1867846 RepID=A0A222P2W2_9GAMM|nr:hypothetical protein clem_08135 [Legionella clemsonensis]
MKFRENCPLTAAIETSENKIYLPKGMIIHACPISSQCGVMVYGEMLTFPTPTQTPYGVIISYELEIPSNTLRRVLALSLTHYIPLT